jgi:hypothetical protein
MKKIVPLLKNSANCADEQIDKTGVTAGSSALSTQASTHNPGLYRFSYQCSEIRMAA